MASTALQIDALWAGLNDPDTGQSYSGAIVAFFESGTTTPKAVWLDTDKTLPSGAGLTQSTLDSNGVLKAFGDGAYKINIYAPTDTGLTTPLSGSIDGAEYIVTTDPSSVGYDSIVDMRAGTGGAEDGSVITLLGYYTPGDGGGGQFYWDATSTDSDDTGLTVKVTSITTGRWKRLYNKTEIHADWYGLSESASAAINATAIQAAIDNFTDRTEGGTVRIPKGTFSCSPDVITLNEKRNVSIVGSTSMYGYETPKAGTYLSFTNGTVGIDISLTGNDTFTSYNKIKNIGVVGSGTTYGILIDGINMIEDSSVSGCTQANIYMRELINSSTINRVSCTGATNYGMEIGSATTNNTTFNIDRLNCRSNGYGLKISNALNLRVTNSVFESNTNEGVIIEKPAGRQCDNITFENCWLENNYVGGSGYQLVIDATTVDGTAANSPASIRFTDCEINASGSQKSINVNAAYGVNFENLSMSTGLGTPGDATLINSSYGRSVFFIEGFPVVPTLGYGNGGGYFEKKFSGSGGFKTDLDIHKAGGRTETVWFVIDTIAAGNTYYLSPITYNAAGITMDSNTYPVLKAGSLVGLITTRRNTIDAGTLTVTPYFRTSWQSAAFDFTGSDVVLNSSSNDDTRTIYGVETYTFISTYGMGVKIVSDGSYAASLGHQMLIGLVIEY